MKKLQLRAILYLQAFLVLALPIFVSFMERGVRPGYLGMGISYAIWLSQRYFVKKCKEQLDERARQILQAVESECFELATAALILAAAWLMIADSHRYVATVLSAVVFLLCLGRAVLFSYWDKRGMNG